MGLDIYAGTLTRYYTYNWKTMTQQICEKNGLKYSIARANKPKEGEEASPEEVLSGVTEWKDLLLNYITPQDQPIPQWNEDYDTTPYYTDKPDWTALGALIIYVASILYKEEYPKVINKGYDFFENELVKRLLKKKEGIKKDISFIHCDGWWIPVEDQFVFHSYLPTGDEKYFATTGQLKSELEYINNIEWKAAREEIIQWSTSEGYPTDAYIKDGEVINKNIHTEYETLSLAKFCFSVLWHAVEFSLEHRVPIIIDY